MENPVEYPVTLEVVFNSLEWQIKNIQQSPLVTSVWAVRKVPKENAINSFFEASTTKYIETLIKSNFNKVLEDLIKP